MVRSRVEMGSEEVHMSYLRSEISESEDLVFPFCVTSNPRTSWIFHAGWPSLSFPLISSYIFFFPWASHFFFEIVRQFALSWTRHSLGSVQPRTCLHFPISLPLSLQLNTYTVVQWLHRVSGHIICGWFITFMSPCVTSRKQFRT